jgi:hypothetical protein
MFRLVERCLRYGDDAAWVELWEVFEEASAGDVRRILTKNGVSPEDADAVVTKCWSELTRSGAFGQGSGSFFGAESAAVAGEPSPPKNVPDPLEPREAAKMGCRTDTPVRPALDKSVRPTGKTQASRSEPSPPKSMLGPREAVCPLRSWASRFAS